MREPRVDEIKRYVSFTDQDTANLRRLGDLLRPSLDRITERFYERIEADEGARAILERSSVPPRKFRETLRSWMGALFQGPHDQAYFQRISRIGHAHVRVRLPQQYMITAMSVVRSDFLEATASLTPAVDPRMLHSLHKILDLELVVMLDSYRQDYDQKVRQAERQRMQQRLEEVSHLANIGELAATLAHEIKNPLAGISGAVQVIASALETDDPHREIIAEILSQIDRLDRAARDLLIYARPKPPNKAPHDIARSVRRTLKFLLQEPALQGVSLRCQGLESKVTAPIDETQFEQVLSNLVLNAAHACEGGRRITIALSTAPDEIHIEVADTGQGMTRDSLERAFEPFFTTKAKGTGLGLSICKRIVEAHGGRIELRSVEGEGTRVRLDLPR